MKPLIYIIAVSILLCGLPAASLAQDEASYAQREAQSQGLDDFRGGQLGVVIAVLVIIALVVLIVVLIGAAVDDGDGISSQDGQDFRGGTAGCPR